MGEGAMLRGMTGHRVVEHWMGRDVETLEDLLRPGLRAVCVGINPAPRSVAAGHYYQGPIGQRFFRRLRDADVLHARAGFEDDAAFADGIGFTDIVKRPTARGHEVDASEFRYGAELLHSKLSEHRPELVIFTFKRTAEALFGTFRGNGFVDGLFLDHSDVFVMPGPMESTKTAEATLRGLAARWH
jgi:double-stranded uracil-DNA glycosylase